MIKMPMSNFRKFIKLARPLHLLLAALTYCLGSGIARYLGHPVQIAAFGLGLLAVLAIQTAAFWLVEYFRLPLTPLDKDETPRIREGLRTGLYQSAMALLTGSGAIVVTLLIAQLLPAPAGIFMGLIVFCFVAYAVPPMRLSEAGYGELIQAIAFGTLFPALAFFLQYGEFHRLLAFATFPLTLLALAYLLVNDFPTFVDDQKYGRHSMLTRLTWQHAIPIHHLLILLCFLFFAVSPLFGYPWGLVWPVFLVLPFALIQIVWLQRIARGGRTLWRFLIPLAAAVFGLSVYLLALTFWIR
jgi:1,4-dihydroxy-2-naphthoate octaprenyltransferase